MTNKVLAEQLKLLTEQNSQLLKFLANQPQNVVNCMTTKGGSEEMPRPLKYGQGCIRKRERQNKNGSVYTWYEIKWYDEYGKRQVKTTPTKTEALNVLSQFNKRSMKTTKKHQKTFGEYMHEWYNTFRSAECGEARNKLNLTQISRMPDSIMNKSLGSVTANELQLYLNTITQPHPKEQTKQLMTACIRHAFNSGHIKSNFGMLLKADSHKAPEKQILPRDMENKFINALPKDYQDYGVGLIYTGCRISEFISLNENWETDIDYQNEVIKIRETKSLRQKDIRAGKTFTYREIPLLPEVAKIKFPLKAIHKQSVNKAFNKANKKLGLKLTPHCMRHTFISRCNELGITQSIIRDMVGHKTERMTIHYTHNTTELVDREFKKLKISTPISTPICSETDKKESLVAL